jgi:ABC-type antimicrobial peptide transport system permease subunit
LIGIAAGLAVTFVLSRFIRDLLFGISPQDPVSLVVVTLIFLSVALLSSYLPARRALRVNPVKALRYE